MTRPLHRRSTARTLTRVAKRTRNNERRYTRLAGVPGSIYIDDRTLTEEAATFDFDSWPADLTCLLFKWYLVSTDSEPGVGLMTFNSEAENDYFWNLSLQNQQGSQASLTDAFTNAAGAFGYIPWFGDQNVWGCGSVEFPDYNFDRLLFESEGDGLPYLAEGTGAFGTPTPDIYTVGGYMQGPGPLLQVTFKAVRASDLGTPQTFKIGSRITAIAF